MRKIAYVTASRSEFGLIYPTLKSIQEHPELELQLIVTGMHLSKEHKSLNIIKKSGLNISKIIKPKKEIQKSSKNSLLFAGDLIKKLTKTFQKLKPDIVFIEADRFEQLPVAFTSSMLNIPIAHGGGGDISGTIDDSIRHSISKFAHIHFPGSKESQKRLIRMGEEPWRIHLVGTPLFNKTTPKEKLNKNLNIDLDKKTILVLQHPVTCQISHSGIQMKKTLEAVKSLGLQTIIIHPNGDPGSKDIIKVIEEYKKLPNFHIFNNLPPATYLGLLENVSVLVGNSSSGIIEAPQFKLPSINIGIREQGRSKTKSTIDCSHSIKEIEEKIKTALSSEFRKSLENMYNPYISENTENKICEVLSSIRLDENLLNKRLMY
jgi:UDP-hydrolysing UDP-N-acetyl-D-glucosamine 2-epimerase